MTKKVVSYVVFDFDQVKANQTFRRKGAETDNRSSQNDQRVPRKDIIRSKGSEESRSAGTRAAKGIGKAEEREYSI